ncbi:ABC transporter ATP-binding protein [Nocardioides sp. DS6]|uniref:ABC transporter ATP-binding protein n=1 Tax=Nocardioides eburneus TaxID=3231482 RepID=A0ABV3SZ25_9ACTN
MRSGAPAQQSGPEEVACAIELDGARRVYELPDLGHLLALHDVHLSVAPGQFVSIIGPSGCGKSTLLRLVAGLEAPDGGVISLGGRTPTQAAEAKLLGFVPQVPALLPWLSVLRNVTLPTRLNRRAARRGADRAETEELLRKAGLGDVMHQLPSQLSGGMRQRTAIVRALALRPEVLLLDEPFSALDEFTREALQELLLDLWGELEATVLFVTHSISEAVRLSDKVVVMAPKPGRIVEVVDIDLPRPRTQELLTSAEFHAYELKVRDLLRGAFEHGREPA